MTRVRSHMLNRTGVLDLTRLRHTYFGPGYDLIDIVSVIFV